jgi:hypothetical protein
MRSDALIGSVLLGFGGYVLREADQFLGTPPVKAALRG